MIVADWLQHALTDSEPLCGADADVVIDKGSADCVEESDVLWNFDSLVDHDDSWLRE